MKGGKQIRYPALQRSVVELHRGINLFSRETNLPEGFALEASNLLPYSPPGNRILKQPLAVSTIANNVEVFDVQRFGLNNTDYIIASTSQGYYANGSKITGIAGVVDNTKLHSLCSFRGNAIFARQGQPMYMWDGVSLDTAVDLSALGAPKAGIVAEYKNRLWALGDDTDDSSSEVITVNLYGVGIGSGFPPSGEFNIYPSDVGDLPAIDFGRRGVAIQSASVQVLITNTTSQVIRIIGVTPTAVDFLITKLPALPYAMPSNTSFMFDVAAIPDEKGERFGNILIQTDNSSYPSLNIKLKVTGTSQKVLPSPSVMSFGQWAIGAPPADYELTNVISNNMIDPVTVVSVTDPTGVFSISGKPASNDVIDPGKSVTMKVKFAPTAVGLQTSSFTFQRKLGAKMFRAWFSAVNDAKTWDRDTDWFDFVDDVAFGGQPVAMRSTASELFVWSSGGRVWGLRGNGPDSFVRGEIELARGSGAVKHQATASGYGAMVWISKTGIYKYGGGRIERISDAIRPLTAQLNVTYHDTARCAIFGDSAIFYFNNTDSYLYYFPNNSWWKIEGLKLGGACCEDGLRFSSTLLYYEAGLGAYHNAYRFDQTAADTTFKYQTGFLEFSLPGVQKQLRHIKIMCENAQDITSVKVYTDYSTSPQTIVTRPPVREGTSHEIIELVCPPTITGTKFKIEINGTGTGGHFIEGMIIEFYQLTTMIGAS